MRATGLYYWPVHQAKAQQPDWWVWGQSGESVSPVPRNCQSCCRWSGCRQNWHQVLHKCALFKFRCVGTTCWVVKLFMSYNFASCITGHQQICLVAHWPYTQVLGIVYVLAQAMSWLCLPSTALLWYPAWTWILAHVTLDHTSSSIAADGFMLWLSQHMFDQAMLPKL